LKEKNLLAAGTSMYWYRSKEQELTSYFTQDGDLVYCCNIPGLMQKFGVEYKVNEWRLFVDSSKRSLKAVLLHNGNNYASLPTGHSVHLQESFDNLKLVLTKIGYTAHDGMICGDLKVCMFLGYQVGYTKYPCCMCDWDSRARSQSCEEKHWTSRISLVPECKNILCKSFSTRRKYCCHPFVFN
jgi:hypothetical protein